MTLFKENQTSCYLNQQVKMNDFTIVLYSFAFMSQQISQNFRVDYYEEKLINIF